MHPQLTNYNVTWYDTLSNQSTSSNSTSVSNSTTTSSSPANVIPSTNATTTTVASSVVQQGTVATNSSGFCTILSPSSSGYTGTISYTAGSSTELWILHTYGIGSNQNVNSTFNQPKIIHVNGQDYAVSIINNTGSSSGES